MRKISLKLLSMGGQKRTQQNSQNIQVDQNQKPHMAKVSYSQFSFAFFVYVFALDLVTYFEVSYIFHFGLYITTLAMAKMLIIDDRIFYS
jgi:hypothetical protein